MLLGFLFLSAPPAFAAGDNKGTEFMLGFMENLGTPALRLFITGDTATTATVEIPGVSFSQSFSVTPGAMTIVSLPPTAFTSGSDVVTNRGVRVTANAEIAVYGLNQVAFTTDAFLGLPVDVLGTEYIVLGRNESVSARFSSTLIPSEFLVAAATDGTTVTITPAISTGSRPAGVPYTVSMNRFHTYQLQSDGALKDLSGSIITSDKPIAVFAGGKCQDVPDGTASCDHLVEQLPPTAAWAKSFLTVSLAGRTGGDRFRIMAQNVGTEVRIDGVLVATLNRAAFHEADLPSDSTHVIETTKPALVMQYAKGSFADSAVSTFGDPFMMMVVPTAQFLSSYTISTPPSSPVSFTNFINVVVPTAATDSCTINGAGFNTEDFSAIGTTSYSAARKSVAIGTHSVACGSPFGLYVYGWASSDSYGYPGGMAVPFAVNQPPVAVNDSFTTAEDTTLATGSVLANDSDPDGDAITPILVAGPVHHQGTFTLNSDGSFTYVPVENFNGTDSFTYMARDPSNAESNVATATITVTPVNDAPVADAKTATTTEDTPVAITLSGTDVETTAANFTWTVGAPAHGTVSGTPPILTYTPAANYNGPDSFTYTITDRGDPDNCDTPGVGCSGPATSAPATVSITVSAVNDPPVFDAIDDQAVNEDTGPQTVTITGVAPGPPDESDQTVTFTTMSSDPAVVQAPVVTGTGDVRTLTFQPVTNANGTAIITVTANDGQAQNNLFSRTFTITVNAVNDPPYFDPIDPPGFDLSASRTVVETEVSITGISAGPPDEGGQLVNVTATSSNTSVIPHPTISGTGSTRTLTFQHGEAVGTADITVLATDDGGTAYGGVNTFSRIFTVTVSGALSGELVETIAESSAPADPAGFTPNEPIIVTVAVTFPTRDFNGDGRADCYFVVPPGNNLVPRVDDRDADNIPEFGPTVFSQAALRQVCDEPLTLNGTVRLTDWYTNLLQTPGTHEFTVTYVNLTEDPEQRDCNSGVLPGADCFSPVLKGIAEASGTVVVGSVCAGGTLGTGAGGTGCPFAVKSTVTLHSVPLGGSPTKAPLPGAQVRVFDRNDPGLQALVTAGGGTNPHPEAPLHALIFEHNVGRVGACTTTTGGVCFAGVSQTGEYLVIVKFVDRNTGQRVYAGREVSPKDFVDGVAAREYQIVKVVTKQGKVQYGGGTKATRTGSLLEMILPDSAIWEGAQFIYPFIFSSDSTWEIDVCAAVPAGYSVVGAYDDNGELVASTTCVQSLVANQTKVVAFEVVDIASPEPSLDATLTIRSPRGTTEVYKVKTSDIRRKSLNMHMHESKAKKPVKSHGAHSHGAQSR